MSEAAKPNGSTPPPAPAAPQTGEDRLIASFDKEAAGDFDVEAFLRADFTKDGSETAQPKPEELPTPAAGAPPSPPVPPPAEPPPAPSPVEQALLNQGETLAQLAQKFQQQQTPAAPVVDPRMQLAREYTVPISPQLVEALRGDDPEQATAAIQALMTVPAVMVHQRMVQEFQNFRASVGEMIKQELASAKTTADMRTDFYGRHAHFDNDFGRRLVVAAAGEVARKNPGKYKGYTPDLGNAIAEEIYSVMPALRPAAPVAPDPNLTRQNPSPAAPVFIPPGARPAQQQEGEVEGFLRTVQGLF